MRQSVSLVRDGRLVAVKYLRVRKYFKGSYQLQSCRPSLMVRGKSSSETEYKLEEGKTGRLMKYFVKLHFCFFRAERLKNILGQILSLFGRHDNCVISEYKILG